MFDGWRKGYKRDATAMVEHMCGEGQAAALQAVVQNDPFSKIPSTLTSLARCFFIVDFYSAPSN